MRLVRTPDDLDELEVLFAACTLADGHRPIGEHKYLSLISEEAGTGLSYVRETSGVIVSYLHLSENRTVGGWTFESAVHPSYRTEDHLIDLAQTAIREARNRGGTTLRTWVFNATWPSSLGVLGFEPERELRQLRVRLPLGSPAYPDDVTLRTFREGEDEDIWLTVNNAAFEGHPENGSWDRTILRDRMSQPWWEPEGMIMAWHGEDLIGFCWTKDHGDGVGEIYIIAVLSSVRRVGIGRALTLDGLASLSARGCSTGMLYVDASNEAALNLYESMGFTLHHIDQSMLARLDQIS